MSEVFSSRRCNVCKIPPKEANDGNKFVLSKLKLCSGCHLIQYCGADHQRLDWPKHKEFCQAIQRILKMHANASHPLALKDEPLCELEMKQAIRLLKILLQIALKRPLTTHEQELTTVPVFCSVCYSLKRTQYVCCRCHGVSYCSMEHAQQHAVDHGRICLKLEMHYCRYKGISMQPDNIPFQIFVQRCANNNFKINNLIETIEFSTRVQMPKEPTKSLRHYQHCTYVSEFSYIATIYFAFAYVKPAKFKDNEITIYIIGATNEMKYFRGVHTRFFFLHNPQITTLNLYYIGPEVEEESFTHKQIYKYLGCDRTINHYIYRGKFHDYKKELEIKPTMVMAFNCGFSEFLFQTELHDRSNMLSDKERKACQWYNGLCKLALFHYVPIFFTSHTRLEAEADFVIMRKAVEDAQDQLCFFVHPIVNLIPNPFRGILPELNWNLDNNEKFWYQNGYIQGVTIEIIEKKRIGLGMPIKC